MESRDRYAVNFRGNRPVRRWMLMAAVLVLVLPVLFFLSVTEFDYRGHDEGIFLLKGTHGSLFELSDDLFLGDEGNLIYAIDFQKPTFSNYSVFNPHEPGEPYLYYEWDKKSGDGFVRSFMPDGTQILTCFSRFIDSQGKEVHGLFIGGGLPRVLAGEEQLGLSQTGMAYYDGKTWQHLWCNINEGITSAVTMKNYYPSEWKFLGSLIRNQSSKALFLKSIHDVGIDGTTLRVERFANFRAGRSFVILVVKVTNVGDRAASYYYCFGDEPWVGRFGSSAGNVGWVKDRLIKTVQWVDTSVYDYAGFFDYGNDLVSPSHDFTYTANFIQWLGDIRPVVFFSNGPNDAPNEKNNGVPLASNERYIGVQWGPRQLMPGQSEQYVLAIGMADKDPKTGFPVKPDLNLQLR